MTSKVEISHKTIIFTIVFLILLWLLIQIVDILFILFISFLLMTALRPLVDGLERVRIPRILAVLCIYLFVFGVVGASFAGMVPQLVSQTTKLIADFPKVVARVTPYWNIDIGILTQQIAPIGENVVKVTLGIFSNIATLLTILVFTFYMLLERRYARIFLEATFGQDTSKIIVERVRKVESRLGTWVQGQLFLMFIIGLSVYIGLVMLHVDYALPLAIIAGLLEIVPVIGPIVSAVPAVLVALGTSPFLALSVAALYFIVQQAENHLIVPLIMRQSTGLSPLITILCLLIGGRLAGVTGAVLSVPALLIIQVFLELYIGGKSTKEGK